MEKIYAPIGWEDFPSEKTPISSENLGKMDLAIDEIDSRVVEHDGRVAELERIIEFGGGGTGGSIAVDDALSETSTNPVQNKVVTKEIRKLSEEIVNLGGVVDTVEALKKAIEQGSGIVSLKRGVEYVLSEKIKLGENMTLIGNGAVIKRETGYENILIESSIGCRISDITIDGSRENMVSPTWDKTIEIATRKNCIIENVKIVNGNEAIIVYGDDVVVKDCKITNCGGNGIHFSGASRSRVENCTIIGANLRSGMGHEDGCIIWSNQCNGATCIGNYCENGKSGFGAIDNLINSEVKIIGNTVKNCDNAVSGKFNSSAPHDIIISENLFYNSGKLELNRVINPHISEGRVTIVNNQCYGTKIEVRAMNNVIISNNIVHRENIAIYNANNLRINNNVVCARKSNTGIYVSGCTNVMVSENTAKAESYTLYVGTSKNIQVCNNNLRQSYDAVGRVINFPSSKDGAYVSGNRVAAFREAFSVESYYTFINNIIDCATEDINAVIIYGGVNNAIATGNRTNGVFKNNAGDSAGIVENNLPLKSSAFVTIATTLSNLTSDAPPMDTLGDYIDITLTPDDGYKLPESVKVTMADVVADVGAYTYDATTGVITIHAMVGNVVIEANGVAV